VVISSRVRAGAIDDAGFYAGGFRFNGDATAPAGVTVVRARDGEGDGGSSDTPPGEQGVDAPVAETPVPPVTDGGGFDLFE
jgi:hypothetical protein